MKERYSTTVPDDMTPADLLKLWTVRDAWNRHDLDTLMSVMTDDCVFEASAGPRCQRAAQRGEEAVRAAYAACSRTFPTRTAQARGISSKAIVACPNGVQRHAKGRQARRSGGCDLSTFREGKIAIKNSFRKHRPA